MKIKEVRREIIGGVTTFLTMAYIVVVNPSILSTPGTNMPFSGVVTATVLLSFFMTLLMGLYARLPYGVAPGMGINAFFTFGLVLGKGIPWPVALGMVFWAGIFFLLLSVTPLRASIAMAIPKHLRSAAAAGIGIFLAFIGLKAVGLVVADPATLVRVGHIGVSQLISMFGLLVMVVLYRRQNPFGILAGIAIVTGIFLLLGKIQVPAVLFTSPDFTSVFFKFRPDLAAKLVFLPAIITIMFTDLFDSISTFVGVSHATNLLDENGDPKNLRQGLLVDALATLSGGLFGSSPGTAYIESAAGIEAGARTGLASVVTAFCFLPCLFLAPLVALVPAQATGPALILVGILMLKSFLGQCLEKVEDVVPAILMILLIPLTFSITQGMLWGFISHTVLYLLCGRGKEISKTMHGITVASALLIALENFPF